MELDDLKQAWNTTNQRLDEMQRLQTAMHKMLLQSQTKKGTNKLRIQPSFELATAVITLVWAGNFRAYNIAKVLRSPAEAIPLALLYALAIFTAGLAVRQFAMISALDYSEPIVETQRKIAALKALRVRSTQFGLLAGLPLWVIFPLIAGQAAFGFEFIRAVSVPWIVGNLVFGVVASAAIVLAARRFGEQSRFFRGINNLLAGAEIGEVQRQLAEIGDFERA